MQTEEFYKKIQERVDQTNFESDWNKKEIWQRIEQQYMKRKKPFVWWQAVAASVLLLGGLGFYFYNQKADITTNNQAFKNLNHTFFVDENILFAKILNNHRLVFYQKNLLFQALMLLFG